METKRCSYCKENKPLSEFWQGKEGYYSYCKNCASKRWKNWLEENRERRRKTQRDWAKRVKLEVVTFYGNGKPACVICGENRLPCLSIDHLGGGGRKHFAELGITSGAHFYQWLKKNNYPKGYQTLCMNCQMIKRAENNENT